jgi:CHAP domain-containing protein
MSLATTIARISELQLQLHPVQPVPQTATTTGQSAFGAQLAAAGLPLGQTAATASTAATGQAAPTNAGQAILNAVRGEVGVSEQPPGSNDSPRIAQYRQATAGSGVGPWCAYFTSWAARQAGVPLGDAGQGFGRVDDVYAWAQRTGKAIPAGQGPPQPGDLIVWDEHIGVVDSVDPNGAIHTIEGNSSDRVSQRTYGPDGGGAIGYVRLG